MKQQITPDNADDYQRSDDGEQIDNPERGCGYLKAGNAYLRADTSGLGILPRFVIFTDDNGDLQPVPYKESMPRGYQYINGTDWLLALEEIRNVTPLRYDTDPQTLADFNPEYDGIEDVPESEVSRHINRVRADGIPDDQSHFGLMDSGQSKDLLMRAGETHYAEAWDFIDEAYEHGLNKGINVSENQRPPAINSGLTRCFIIHPTACGDDMPGIVGFTYLTRVIYTKDSDGKVPEYASADAAADRLDIVEIGEPEPIEDEDYDDIAETHSRDITDFDGDCWVTDGEDGAADHAGSDEDEDEGNQTGVSDEDDTAASDGSDGDGSNRVEFGCENQDCMGSVKVNEDGIPVCSSCDCVHNPTDHTMIDCPRDCDGYVMADDSRPGTIARCDTDGQAVSQAAVRGQIDS